MKKKFLEIKVTVFKAVDEKFVVAIYTSDGNQVITLGTFNTEQDANNAVELLITFRQFAGVFIDNPKEKTINIKSLINEIAKNPKKALKKI